MKKAAKGQPFLPMFVGDFMAATLEWEGEEQALYALMLMHQWAIGNLPVEVSKLARLVKYDIRNFERWWPVVSSKFEQIDVPGVGPRLMNSRLEQHRSRVREVIEKKSAAGKLGAEAKWQRDGISHKENVANASEGDGISHISAKASNPIQSNPTKESSDRSSLAQTPVAQVSPASLFPDEANGFDSESIERVFAHWRDVHQHPRAQLDSKRRKLIRDRLKNYTEADLCQAISGYRNSPHHMGQNESGTTYDALELLLRDAKRIDAGLKFFEQPPRSDLSAGTRRAISQTENWEPPSEQRRAG